MELQGGYISNMYFYDGRPFQTAELKLLLDAVDAASFIGPVQTAALYEKLLSQASVYEQEKLQLEHAADPKRISNSKILYITDLIQQAMREKKKIRFQYADIQSRSKRIKSTIVQLEYDFRLAFFELFVRPV